MKEKLIYMHIKDTGVTKGKSDFEGEFAKKIKNSKLSIRWDLKGKEAIVKFYDTPENWFMAKSFSMDIIKLYKFNNDKERKDCLILLQNRSGQKKRKKFPKIYSMWLVTKY